MPKLMFGVKGEKGLRPSAVFAARLRKIRDDRGLSQAELARQMTEQGRPMSKAAVLRIENGERGLSLDEALAFATVLSAVPAHLLSPPDGEHVWLTESLGLTGAELRNWLLFGDPLLVSTEGKRVRVRMNTIFMVEKLAQAIVDAKRGGDEAGSKATVLQLHKVIGFHKEELEAIEREEKS
jgi:transcriptional regulator with XRE-family HTH domain